MLKFRHVRNALLIAMITSAWYASAQVADRKAEIAYSYQGVVYLATATGRNLRVIKSPVPIGDFALSPDLQFVVFAKPYKKDVTGGALWIFNISTNELKPMPPDPYYNRYWKGARREFYADPEFSPDGGYVVFAAHSQATGDAVESSGPFEILSLQTREIRILKDTLDDQLQPLGYAYAPHWSPDGQQILINFDGAASITNVAGTRLRDLDIPEAEYSSEGYGMFAIGWFGSRCVLYETGDDPDRDPARILNLNTGKTTLAATVLHLPERSLLGIEAFSDGIRVQRGSKYRVENLNSSWQVPGDTNTTYVRLIGSHSSAAISSYCK